MADETTPAQPAADRPRRRRRWPYVLLAFALLVSGGLFWAYRSLSDNITTIDPSAGLGDVRPAKENQSMNILLIGSDSREGANSSVGGESPGLADTTIVLHLSADNSWATAVSIPRDSMVQMPDCVASDGSTHAGAFRQFNQAYTIGGPVCVQRTVEATTGLHIDHFAVVDFSGFSQMVDALGGVTIYVESTIDDPSSDIHFDPGCQVLDGDQALDYVRVRHGVTGGEGSDLGRIKRQQQFLSAVVQEVTSKGTLLNPVALYSFLDAATKAVTTDTGLGSVQDLASIAVRVRHIGLSNVTFATIPVVDWPQDPNRVIWAQPDAGEVWDALRLDQPLRAVEGTGSASPSTPPSPSASSTGTASPSAGGEASATSTPTPSVSLRGADEPICQ
jgi:LCP family protein required for cell wall assembly